MKKDKAKADTKLLTAVEKQRGVMWFRRKIKDIFGLHDIEDLVIGGHCGVCGKWMPNDIFVKEAWGLCEDCKTT